MPARFVTNEVVTDRACIAPFFSDLDISTCDIVSVTYVCVCVCMCVCIHVCVCACIKERETHTYARTHAHTRTERERAIVRERERERVREGGRARKNKHVRHILCYKMYKMLDGMKHHTQSQSMFTFCLIKPYQPFNPNKDIHNTQSNHIFTQREREYKKKSKHVLVWKPLLQIFAHLCLILLCGPSSRRETVPVDFLSVGEASIQFSDVVNTLGVTLDGELSVEQHV